MTRCFGWGLTAVGALSLACGGTVKLREGGESQGGTSASGSNGEAGVSQQGGAGAATNAPSELDPCIFELYELCGDGGCPESTASLATKCADSHSLTKTPTDCGGSVVVDSAGFFATSWFFDGEGQLMGVRSISDVLQTCSDGRSSFTSSWGTTCKPDGASTDGCLPADGCSPKPLSCDASQDCPASPEDVMADFCGKKSTLSVLSTPTTCGGSLLLVENTDGAVRYCFDDQGRLVGTKSTPGTTGIEANTGSDCIANGVATYACSDDPQ